MTLKSFQKPAQKIFLLAFILFSFQIDSSAQDKRVITSVDEAISLALKNNSAIVTAYLDKLKAEEKVSEVYSENLVPSVTLNSRYTRAFKKQLIDIFGQRFEIGADNSLTNTFDFTESLPVLGTPVFTGIRIAENFLKIQTENIVAVEIDVKAEVKRTYYGALLSKAVVDVNKLSLKNAEDNFSVVSARYRNGVATEFDFLRAQLRVDNVKPVLSQSERNYEISRKALINAIGFKSTEDVDVAGEISYDSNEVWADTDYMINKISENYVQVRQLQITRNINRELVKIDKANYLPKLKLFGQYSISAQENDGKELSRYGFYNTVNAGLELSWDLNLFRNSYKVNQAEIEVKKSEEQIIDVKQKLKLISESAIIALEDAKERIIAQKKTVSLAERSFELANASYRAGALNQIDVQDAIFALSQAKLAYNQAIYDYQVAKAELEKLLEK